MELNPMLKKIKNIIAEKTEKPLAVPGEPAEIYRDIFEHAAVATAIIGEDGTFTLVNRKFEQLSGWSSNEIENKKSWRELVVPDDVEKLTRYTEELMKPGGQVPATCSFGLVDKTGNQIPMMLSIKRIPEANTVIASLMENTVQKKLEEMLRINEARYRTLVNDLPMGVYRNKLENPGKFLWANPALIRMYGYDSLEEFVKNPVLGVYADPRDRDRFIDELLREGFVRNFEVIQKRKDGSLFWVRITARPKKNRDGEIEWLEGVIEDLTNERTARELGSPKSLIATAAFDSATGVAILSTDPSGTIMLANRGTGQMLGYSADELIGKQTPLLFHLESELTARSRALSEEAGDLITGFEIFTRPLEVSEFEEREWTWVKKDTTTISIYLTVTQIHTETGNLMGYLFTAKEITSEKRLEEAFRNANLQMSGVIYNLPDATFAISHDGRVIAWNRAMEDLTGIKVVDILGRGNYEYALPFYGSRRPMLIDLITEPDEKIQERRYGAIRRKGNAVIAESPALDDHNEVRILWSIAAPIFDAAGELAGGIESIADITERRKRETALQDSVVKYREILDNTGSATAIIEEDSTISYINPEFGRILGYVREEIEGKKKWMEFVVPEDVRGLQDHWEKAAHLDEGLVRYDVRFIRWDGEVRNAFLTITGIPGTKKVVVAILDITDKIKAETAVQLANRKINFLTGIIRHDILNHLTVLKGNLELAKEQAKDPASLAGITKELAAADAIQSLISFTRDYQDIGIEPPEWQDLKKTIMRSCTGIHIGGISLTVEIDAVEIYADRLLERVFHFLIANAVTHGGEITRIRLFFEESFEELHVICEDDGVGIPPEEKVHIFQRQFFTSTGLELHLAREILSITGISIQETGEYLTGARFEIHVPKGGYRFIAPQQ